MMVTRMQALCQALATQRNQAMDNAADLVSILAERDGTIAQQGETIKQLQDQVAQLEAARQDGGAPGATGPGWTTPAGGT